MNDPRTAAAVISAAKAKYDEIPLAKIDLSQTPMQKLRRERFDKPALKELTQSVAEHGVLQPVLVRRHEGPVNYELVAGERRYLASKAAGLPAIPAIVRTLTDLQVVEMQVIENNQREDLHKLIEAEGFEQLMKAHKFTADDIAAKIGKSRSYVYAVLKYTDLCPEARRAFYDGKLDPSKALLIARIGHHDTQRAALADVTEGLRDYGGRRRGEPLSYRDAHKHIVATYTLNLKSAVFDTGDANLVAKAGACAICPKKTGNQRELFGDIKNADVCTDPKCFDDKRQAHFAVARRKLEAEGHTVIYGADAKKVMPQWDGRYGNDHLAHGYQRLDDTTYATGRGLKVSDLIGPERKPVLIQHPGTGKIIHAATPHQIAAAVAEKQKARAKTEHNNARSSAPKPAGPDLDQLVERKVFELLGAKVPAKVSAASLREIALTCVDQLFNVELLAVALGLPGKATQTAVETKVKKMKEGELVRVITLCQLAYEIDNNGDLDYIEGPLKTYKIDPAKIRLDIVAEQKAKADAEKAKRAAKATAAKKGKGKK